MILFILVEYFLTLEGRYNATACINRSRDPYASGCRRNRTRGRSGQRCSARRCLNSVETSSSARAALGARHSFTIDAKVCRRLIARSCVYQGVTPTTALEAIRADTGAHETLVIGAGYNDVALAPAVDALIAEARSRGIGHVVWINYYEAGPYATTYAQHNAVLSAKLADYPELSVIDWEAAVSQHRDWTGNDGLHLTPLGTQAMATIIGDALDGLRPTPPRPVSRCGAARVSPGIPGLPSSGAGPIGLYPLPAPVRFLDTRQLPAPIDHHGTVTVPIAGRLGIPTDGKSLVWVGRMVPVKAVDVLLRACAALEGDLLIREIVEEMDRERVWPWRLAAVPGQAHELIRMRAQRLRSICSGCGRSGRELTTRKQDAWATRPWPSDS